MRLKLKNLNQNQEWAWLILMSSIVFLFCFRPIVAYRVYGNYDDPCYLAMAAKWVGIMNLPCGSSSYAPGISFMWLPATLCAWLFSKVLGLFGAYFETEALMPVLIGILGYLYWVASYLSLHRILKKQVG